ncbi:hypothetical protein EAF04_003713 [Stromatinia cepivora]|nr:hypothetical protein EAF04_003713 [Stromatinia cepivora]
MNPNIQEFTDACRAIKIPVPIFVRIATHNSARFVLEVTILGHRIRSHNPETSFHAAKISLARRAMHYLQRARTPAPPLVLGPGGTVQHSSNAKTTQNQAVDSAHDPHVLSAYDQKFIEHFFGTNILNQLGPCTRAQVTAVADHVASIILERPESRTMEWNEAMRIFTERLIEKLNEGTS